MREERIQPVRGRGLSDRGLFFLLLVVLAGFQGWILHPDFVPRNDTVYGLHLFHFFYTHWFFHHDIARWMPFNSFGLPTQHDQLIGITPVSAVIMAIGSLFQVRDSLFLFKLSLLLEQAVFCAGMFLLSRRVFESRWTVFLVGVGSLAMGNLLTQVYFDFRFYRLLPLALYTILRFFETRHVRWLGLTALLALANDMGNPLYFIVVWFFLLSIFFGVLWAQNRPPLSSLWPRDARDWIIVGLVFLFLAAFFWHLKTYMAFIDLAPRGEGGRTPLKQFLTWGGVHGMNKYWHDVLLGVQGSHAIGLLPWIFVISACLRVRSKLFAAFGTLTLSVLWLSVGGVFALVMYFFPLLAYYRHIGLLDALISVCVLVCAGFGMDRWLRLSPGRAVKEMALCLLIFIFILDVFYVSGQWFSDLAFAERPQEKLWMDLKGNSVFVRAFLYGLGLGLWAIFLTARRFFPKDHAGPLEHSNREIHCGPHRGWVLTFVLLFVVDCGWYQWDVFQRASRLPDSLKSSRWVFDVHRPVYQPQRDWVPRTGRAREAWRLLKETQEGSPYTTSYSFLQFDPCHSEFETLMTSRRFQELLKTRPRLDADLWAVLGCQVDKLRFVDEVLSVESDARALETLRREARLFRRPVVTIREKTAAVSEATTGREKGHITVLSFDPNRIILETRRDQPGWLIYADAYHPAWDAKLDGRSVTVVPATHAFKAIPLPAGRHHLVLQFTLGNARWSAIVLAVMAFGIGWGLLSLPLFIVVKGVPETLEQGFR